MTGFIKPVQIAQEMKSILLPEIKANTLALPRRTKHMTKDDQGCFHRRLFANLVKPQRCTTKPVKPLDGIDKDVSSAKLLLMTTSIYPVDCARFSPLLRHSTTCCVLSPMEAVTRLWLPTYLHHPTPLPPTHLYTLLMII